MLVAHLATAAAVFLIGSVPRAAAEPTAPTIHLIGDSTMADKPRADLPERGWGQLFPEVVIAPAKVDNQARNGRSTRSFVAERRWQEVVASLKPGDWVIIQFGHNDQKADNPKVHAAADTDYRANLRKFIAETRAKAANPVIATPVVRRRWSADGKFVDTLGDYPAAARAVASDASVPLLELHDLTMKMESDAGVEGSKRFHFPGDDTHYSEAGARAVAALAASEIHRLKLPLARWIRLDDTNQSGFRIAPRTLGHDEVTLVWDKPATAPTDTIYRIFCNDREVGTTRMAFHTAAGLAANTSHTFSLRAGGETIASLRVTTTARPPVISITDHGALGDGRTLNTKSIQAVIDACPRGGVVLVPRGVFVCGALFLKSDMTLQIAKGGVLKGSTDVGDYLPLIRTRFEGWEMETYASLINAGKLDHAGQPNIRNISIRGEGRISGGGSTLAKAMIATKGLRGRGRLVCLMNADNVELAGVTLEESPCWTLHYIYSSHVTCRGLTIRSNVRNGDGIDPDSSADSLVLGCAFDTGDDCIAIKSGKNPEGNAINRPTERVLISGCRFDRGHGISIGSEMSGGIRGVRVEDCVAGPLLHGMQIKATKDRGGLVEDITVRDCDLRKISVLTELNYNNDGAPASEQPIFRNFTFSNIDLSKGDPSKPLIIVNGFSNDGHRARQVAFDRIRLPSKARIEVDQAEDVSFSNIHAEGGAPVWKITRSHRINGIAP